MIYLFYVSRQSAANCLFYRFWVSLAGGRAETAWSMPGVREKATMKRSSKIGILLLYAVSRASPAILMLLLLLLVAVVAAVVEVLLLMVSVVVVVILLVMLLIALLSLLAVVAVSDGCGISAAPAVMAVNCVMPFRIVFALCPCSLFCLVVSNFPICFAVFVPLSFSFFCSFFFFVAGPSGGGDRPPPEERRLRRVPR